MFLRAWLATLAVILAAAVPQARAESASRAFTARDLIMLARLSDPQLNGDGKRLAYVLRETDWDANRGRRSIWRQASSAAAGSAVRITAVGSDAWSPRWSRDGHSLFFLSDRSGSAQLWRLDDGGGEARQVSQYPLDIEDFVLAPDGVHIAFSMDVFPDCGDLPCTRHRLDARAANKATGRLYERLFVRHWDTWADGRRHQLFAASLAADGTAPGEPTRVTTGIDGDAPSKPFGDDTEYSFSPDSATLYFDVRIAGTTEAWSTNFDVYAVPADGHAAPRNLTAANLAWDANPLASPDGKRLYYLAMKRPGFESDRFGIMELNLQSGALREVAPAWDRSAGPLQISPDGRTLYTTADDQGNHALFTVDVSSGAVRRIAADGNITGFTTANGVIVIARDAIEAPAEAFRVEGVGRIVALTAVNAERLKGVTFTHHEDFHFNGWHGDPVRGYVVWPYGYVAGRKYPVAFIIHGGPQGSWLDEFHYRWNPEVLAGAGYAVVAIDFHGSTGYGQAFTDAISQHWGDRPLEDLQKGWAAALAKYSFLQGDDACALGASYGGYMVNWIAGVWNTPASGAWRCLVSHDGEFDVRASYFSTEELWSDEWEFPGTPWENPQAYERFNPFTHVADWKIPMLIIHGERDYRVSFDQGMSAFNALQRRGIPSEFLEFPDENHWVLKPQDSMQWHETVLAWLHKWTAKGQ